MINKVRSSILTIVFLLCFCLMGLGQEGKIVIEEFKKGETNIEADNNKKPIAAKTTYTFQVVNSVKTFSLMNKEGNYIKQDKANSITGFDSYIVSELNFKDGKTTVKLGDGTNEMILNFAITQAPKPNNPNPESGDCTSCEFENMAFSDFDSKLLVYYDFDCKAFYQVDGATKKKINLAKVKLQNRDQIQFKIVNINRYLYDISVSGVDVKYESEMPALLKKLFIGDSTFLGGLMTDYTSAITAQGSSGEILEKITALNDAIKEFQHAYNQLQSQKLKAFYICEKFKCCSEAQYVDYGTLANNIVNIKHDLAALQLAIKKDKEINSKKESLTTKKALLAKCQAGATNKAALEKKISEEKDDEKKKKLKTELDELVKTLADCKDTVNAKKEITALEGELVIFSSLDKLELNLPSEKDLMSLVLFANNVRAQGNYFLTPPMYVSGNRFELNIKMKPRDSSLVTRMNIMPLYSDSIYVDAPVYGKSLISFSSGSFIGFGDVVNKTYDWQQQPNNGTLVTDSSKYLLVESGLSPKPVGFSAFANLQWKLCPDFGLGISAGVGLTVEKKPRTAYLGGISLLFGDMHQFVLTYGACGMYVDKLKSNMIVGTATYSAKQDIEYQKEFKVGQFLSLSYTPFKTNKRRMSNSSK